MKRGPYRYKPPKAMAVVEPAQVRAWVEQAELRSEENVWAKRFAAVVRQLLGDEA